MSRLELPSVTLCAATSVNVSATVMALEACLNQVEFAQALLFTHSDCRPTVPALDVVKIVPIQSKDAYSRFILYSLADHVRTEHCLIVQWDGFVLDARQWDPTFLAFDYVGAPWPQFNDRHNVGNGGFSLRSKRLLHACRDARFRHCIEDLAICRVNRPLLENDYGLRFADAATAERFAYERSTPDKPTFGFHGLFNMIEAVGPERFWELYIGLDDPTLAFIDYCSLMRQLREGRYAFHRRAYLTSQLLSRFLGFKLSRHSTYRTNSASQNRI